MFLLLKSIWEIPPLYVLDCLPMNIALVHHVRHESASIVFVNENSARTAEYAWHKTFTVLFRIYNWFTRQGRGNILVAARLEYFHAPAL